MSVQYDSVMSKVRQCQLQIGQLKGALKSVVAALYERFSRPCLGQLEDLGLQTSVAGFESLL